MSELKACPWCQRPATLLDPATTTVPLVACVHDDCPLNEWMTVGEWNNRRADDAGRLREALREIVGMTLRFDRGGVFLPKHAWETIVSLASLPASPSAEPCQKCGGHPTVKCLHCLPAPAKEDEKR